MDEWTEFKKWLCEKAKYNYQDIMGKDKWFIILVKAMFAINRNGDWCIVIYSVSVGLSKYNIDGSAYEFQKNSAFTDHNNSELEALEEALKYIYKQELKNDTKDKHP